MDPRRFAIVNGPNLNLVGTREPSVYGNTTFDVFMGELRNRFSNLALDYFQSNIEGELIDYLQSLNNNYSGVVINPGGYSHTSVALADAIATVSIPVIEVHISNVHAREDYRKQLITGSRCKAVISGLGMEGYAVAIQFLSA